MTGIDDGQHAPLLLRPELCSLKVNRIFPDRYSNTEKEMRKTFSIHAIGVRDKNRLLTRQVLRLAAAEWLWLAEHSHRRRRKTPALPFAVNQFRTDSRRCNRSIPG